jgi:hypothetical protein
MQAIGEIYSAARTGVRPAKYVGAPILPWHHALLLLDALAHAAPSSAGLSVKLLVDKEAHKALLMLVAALLRHLQPWLEVSEHKRSLRTGARALECLCHAFAGRLHARCSAFVDRPDCGTLG